MSSASQPLQGQVALVTGGASGLGAAIAAELAARGAQVALTDVNEAALAAADGGFIPLRADNRNVADVKAAVADLLARTGRIDILVNNAGISGYSRPIEAIDEADFDAMFGTHVKGAFFFAQAVVPGMKARRSGRIVNISSNFAMTGFDGMSHYVAAKSALLGLTKAWARELAPCDITVNAVAPGLVATPLTRDSIGTDELAKRARTVPLGRLAEPREIAYAVAWLVGPEAAMMTGQTVSPNGGASVVGI
ncbi:MAG: SDR family oxidoreductase [Proteobacteria bacterium]|nr:SDR family oxidoreductase [Pseudomonadota bacterium]